MQNEKGNDKMKKGFLTVHVGLEDDDIQGNGPSHLHKFVIPIRYLYHPRFNRLLNRAGELYGYKVDGPLRLPCSVEDFITIQRLMEQDGSLGHRQRYPHPIFNSYESS